MKKQRLKQPSEFKQSDLFSLLNYSTHDYIAARTLLLSHQAGPGTIMAITAMEKMFKVILLLNGKPIVVDGSGHRLVPMITTLMAIDNSLFTSDHIVFLSHIDKAYKIRYPDKIDPKFRLFLPTLKILENLDLIYCHIINSFPVSAISPGAKLFDMYLIGANDKRLLMNCNAYYYHNLRGVLSSRKQTCTAYSAKGNSYIEWYKPSTAVKADNNWNEPPNFNK